MNCGDMQSFEEREVSMGEGRSPDPAGRKKGVSVRFQYYERMKVLARESRAAHGIAGPRVLRSDMKRIFKEEGITFDYWPGPLKKIRGAYFNDEAGATIMIRKGLPPDPSIF